MSGEGLFQRIKDLVSYEGKKRLDEACFFDRDFYKAFLYKVWEAVHYFAKKEGKGNVFVRDSLEKLFYILKDVLFDFRVFEKDFLNEDEKRLFLFLLKNGARLVFHHMADKTGFYSILYFLVYYWERSYYRKILPEVKPIFEFSLDNMGASFDPEKNRIFFYLNNLLLYTNEYCPVSFLLHEVSHQLFTIRESYIKSGLSVEEFVKRMKELMMKEHFLLVNVMEDLRCERKIANIKVLRRYLRSGIGFLMRNVLLEEARRFFEEFFDQVDEKEKRRLLVFVCGIFMRFYLFPEVYGVRRIDFYKLFTEKARVFIEESGKEFWDDFVELVKRCCEAETIFEVEKFVKDFYEKYLKYEPEKEQKMDKVRDEKKDEIRKERGEKEKGEGEGKKEGVEKKQIEEVCGGGEGRELDEKLKDFISGVSDLKKVIEGLCEKSLRDRLIEGEEGKKEGLCEELQSGGSLLEKMKKKFEEDFEEFVEEFAKKAEEIYDRVKSCDRRSCDEEEYLKVFSAGVKGSIISTDQRVGCMDVFLMNVVSFEKQRKVWESVKDGRKFARYLVNRFRYFVEEKVEEGERIDLRSYLFRKLNLVEDGEIFLSHVGLGVGMLSFVVDVVVDCSGSMHFVEDRTVKGLGFLMGVFKELEKLLLGNVRCNLFLVKGQGGTGYLIDVTDFLKREGRDNLSRYVDVISRISFDGSFEAFSMYLSRLLEGRRPDIAIVLTDAQFVDKRDWEVLKEVRGKIPLCGFYVISDEKESEEERESMQKRESVILKNFEMVFDYWTVGSLREMKEFVEKLLRMGFEGSQEFNARKFLQECRKRKMKEERKLDFSRYVM